MIKIIYVERNTKWIKSIDWYFSVFERFKSNPCFKRQYCWQDDWKFSSFAAVEGFSLCYYFADCLLLLQPMFSSCNLVHAPCSNFDDTTLYISHIFLHLLFHYLLKISIHCIWFVYTLCFWLCSFIIWTLTLSYTYASMNFAHSVVIQDLNSFSEGNWVIVYQFVILGKEL